MILIALSTPASQRFDMQRHRRFKRPKACSTTWRAELNFWTHKYITIILSEQTKQKIIILRSGNSSGFGNIKMCLNVRKSKVRIGQKRNMKFQELPCFNMIIYLPSCYCQGTLRSSRQAATFSPLKDWAVVIAAKIKNNRRFAVRKNVFFKRSQEMKKNVCLSSWSFDVRKIRILRDCRNVKERFW